MICASKPEACKDVRGKNFQDMLCAGYAWLLSSRRSTRRPRRPTSKACNAGLAAACGMLAAVDESAKEHASEIEAKWGYVHSVTT